jgi:hypothetical protein
MNQKTILTKSLIISLSPEDQACANLWLHEVISHNISRIACTDYIPFSSKHNITASNDGRIVKNPSNENLFEILFDPKPFFVVSDDFLQKEGPTIYLLVLDSTSRITLEMFAPNLMSKLKEDLGFEWYPNFYPVSPGTTRAAMFSSLYGGVKTTCKSAISELSARNTDFREIARNCTDENDRLFGIAKKLGYRTTYSDTIGSKQYILPEDLSNILPEDSFYASIGGGENTQPDHSCFGENMLGYQKVLKYNEEILNDGKYGKFLVSHLTASHESPKYLEMIETDLIEHIKRIDESIQRKTATDSIFIVMSDHGIGDIACDSRKPFLFIKHHTHNISITTLKTDQRVSHWDIYHFLDERTFK